MRSSLVFPLVVILVLCLTASASAVDLGNHAPQVIKTELIPNPASDGDLSTADTLTEDKIG